jgi:uncharacterized protein YjbI with pentapeptide repeats
MLKPGSTITGAELLAAYRKGERNFRMIRFDGARLSGVNLTGASFYMSSLRNVDLSGSTLQWVQLKGADLTSACLSSARINAADLIAANFTGADLSHADFTGASLNEANLTLANMTRAYFGNATFSGAQLAGAKLNYARVGSTHFDDVDVSAFCGAAKVKHVSPSFIDSRTVMKSYLHPKLKRFLIDCGVAEIFAEYMIDCARALGEPVLKSLMQSTFISYGGPDEQFARRLYDALRAHNVMVFFFPETATVGERIDSEVFRRIQQHDRVLLVCSRESLNRGGVINEIQETLDREARDGGATYLLPIMLDDYVLAGWRKTNPVLAERIGRRIVADFRKARRSKRAFDYAMARVIDALKVKRPT